MKQTSGIYSYRLNLDISHSIIYEYWPALKNTEVEKYIWYIFRNSVNKIIYYRFDDN